MFGTCTHCNKTLYGTTVNTMTHLPGERSNFGGTLVELWFCDDTTGNKAEVA